MADFKLMNALDKSCNDVINQSDDLLDYNECASAEMEEIVWCLRNYAKKFKEELKRASELRSKAQV